MGQGGKGHKNLVMTGNRTKNRSLDQNIGPIAGHGKGHKWSDMV